MKKLERMRVGGTRNRMQLDIPLPKTPEGRVYRYSPNENAHPRHFVLGSQTAAIEPDERQRARMKLQPRSTQTVCPYSGIIAGDDEFTHPDDVKAAMKIIAHAARDDVAAAIDEMLAGAARRSSGMLSYRRGRRHNAPRPRFGRRDLMRLLVCDHCGRDYGVFAIALFCPDCGAPNIALHFGREVELVGQQVELAEGLSADQQELAYRLLGNAHEDVLTAFEATLKTLYAHGKERAVSPSQKKPVGNDFQNVERGQKRFAELGIDPFQALTAAETGRLQLNIQKRHVVGHNLGIVDAKFTEAANDAKLGETVKLVGADIKEFAALCQKVVGGLDNWLGGQTPPMPPGENSSDNTPSDTEAMDEQVGDLKALPAAIASWICRSSITGLPELVAGGTLVSEFAGNSPDQLAEAIAELEADGFVTTSHALGVKIPHVRSTEDLFLTFDPVILKTYPVADAVRLGELVLDGRESVGLRQLHAESGLPLRQFNPAISIIVSEVGDGRVSRSLGELDYPARSFFLAAEDRVAIRQLLKRLEG